MAPTLGCSKNNCVLLVVLLHITSAGRAVLYPAAGWPWRFDAIYWLCRAIARACRHCAMQAQRLALGWCWPCYTWGAGGIYSSTNNIILGTKPYPILLYLILCNSSLTTCQAKKLFHMPK